MRTSDYMKVSSVHFWKTISLWCDNEFCGKGWFCLGKCVRIFLFLLQLCKGEGVHWWSCSCLYSHRILLFCCLNSPTLLKMTSFLWRIFANIKQFHHGSWKKKKKKWNKTKTSFAWEKCLVLVFKFYLDLVNAITMFTLSLTNSHVVSSIAAALPNNL